jgi:hypothetical protein
VIGLVGKPLLFVVAILAGVAVSSSAGGNRLVRRARPRARATVAAH